MAKRIASCGLTLEEVFLSETEHREDFAKIFTVLDEVVGASWDGECAVFPDPKRVKPAI